METKLKSETQKAAQLGDKLKWLVKQQLQSIATHAKDMNSLQQEMTWVSKEYDTQSKELEKVNAVI